MAVDKVAREQIRSQALRLSEQIAAQREANQIVLNAAEKAVLTANAAMEKRFDGVNEFRQTLSDQAATFVSRKEMEALIAKVVEDVKRLETRESRMTGGMGGADYLWRTLIAFVAVIIAASMLYLAFRRQNS